jgi:rubrerythrin
MVSEEIDKVAGLIDLEKKYASSLSESVENLRNVVVRETLKGIAHDSIKHASFFRAILSLIRDVEPVLAEDDYDRLEKVIEGHISVEERMLEESRRLLSSLKNLWIKHLLKEIYDDEVKHHALMTRLLEAVINREALFEDDWWDTIWKERVRSMRLIS